MFAYPLDEMVGGILYEHSHRMIASIVGLLTVVLAIWLWRREERRWVRNLGFIAVAAVIAQGILGGLTVRFLLPTPVSVSHATLAQTFLAIMTAIALVTSPWWRDRSTLIPELPASRRSLGLFSATVAALFIQLILGALMRHTESGLAVPDFPLAYGQLFPSLTPEAMADYNRQLLQSDIRIAADGAITSAQVVIHLTHRLWALVTGFLIIWASIRLLRLSDVSRRISRMAYVLLGLLLLQITLGGLTVLSQKAVDITTAHVATGALLLATTVLSMLHIVRISGLRFSPLPVMAAPKGATT